MCACVIIAETRLPLPYYALDLEFIHFAQFLFSRKTNRLKGLLFKEFNSTTVTNSRTLFVPAY